MPETTEALLELNCERVIVLADRRHDYWLVCRRITSADWLRYFAGILITSQQEGRERVNVIDVTTPRLELAEAVLKGAQGYKVAGGIDLMSLPNWQIRIPLAHRLQLGEILADVRPSAASDDLTIYPEGEVVLLDATWSAIDGLAQVQRFSGLKHVLRTPTEDQHRRYSRESSRSRVVGGSRSGKTVYAGSQPLLAKLYDELVVSVEGYSLNGNPLGDAATIIREMDMIHKVVAAQELFQPQSTASVAGEEEMQ